MIVRLLVFFIAFVVLSPLVSVTAGQITARTSSVWMGSNGNNNLAQSGNNFFPVQGSQTQTVTEAIDQMVVPVPGVVSNLFCLLSGTPGGSATYVITFRKGGDTALTCTVASAATTCSDLADAVTVAAGDVVAFNVVGSGTPTARSIRCSVRFNTW